MAITLDSQASTAASTAPTSITITVGTLTNGLIILSTNTEDFGADGAISSVTAAHGLTFTKQKEVLYNPSGTTEGVSVWTAPIASLTAGSVVITIAYAGGVDFGIVFASSFSGVDQTTPVEAVAEQTYTSGTSYSQTITTLSANALVFDSITHNDGTATLTKGASQTQIAQLAQSTNVVGATSYLDGGSAGSKTMAWTSNNAGSRVVHAILSLKSASAAAAVFPSSLCLMGVG